MFSMNNIPPAVYLVALDLMGVERPADPEDAPAALSSAESRCDYHLPTLVLLVGPRDTVPLGAFAAAVAMYLASSGPFAEDGGEFSGQSGVVAGSA